MNSKPLMEIYRHIIVRSIWNPYFQLCISTGGHSMQGCNPWEAIQVGQSVALYAFCLQEQAWWHHDYLLREEMETLNKCIETSAKTSAIQAAGYKVSKYSMARFRLRPGGHAQPDYRQVPVARWRHSSLTVLRDWWHYFICAVMQSCEHRSS